MDIGQVETIAHYRGAMQLVGDVSFILDIGGQDMKAIFIEDGIINRLRHGTGVIITTGAINCEVSVILFNPNKEF